MPHKDPEVRRAYQQAYRERHRDELVTYINAWKRNRYATDEAYREKVKAASRAVPSHVWAARWAVRRAIRDGEMARPSECEECGCESFIEAAHYSYDRPLDVRWLCRTCHRKWDAAQPKGYAV